MMTRLLPKQLQDSPKTSLSLACLVFIGILLLEQQGILQFIELFAYDLLIQFRPKPEQSSPPIILVKVTEDEITRLRCSLTDAELAEILQRLIDSKPRVIGLDIYRNKPIPPGHSQLNAVLSRNDKIITIMELPSQTRHGISGPPVLRDTNRIGFSDIVLDPGGAVRRGLLYMEDRQGINQFSFSLLIALRYLFAEKVIPMPDPKRPDNLRLGSITFTPLTGSDGGYANIDAKGYQFLLDFKDDLDNFTSYTISDLLHGKIKPESIRDKIVLVGVTAYSVKDDFWSPVTRHRHAPKQPLLTMVRGIELHALMINQLLRHGLQGHPAIKALNDRQKILWLLAWCILGLVIGLHADHLIRFAGLFLLGFATLFSTAWLALSHDLWIPLATPALAWTLTIVLVAAYSSSQQKQQRSQLMSLFSRHVAPEIAERIWDHRDQFTDSGLPQPQRLTATVMFTDICHFTSISESLPPSDLVNWINEYMETLVPIIERHGGVINKFIGDAIMAMFGAPLPRSTRTQIKADAQNAVMSALAIQNELKQRNMEWEQRGLPAVGMRIGIYTGDVVAGSVGAQQRMEYTLYGDTVNIAARLETFDKDSFNPHPFDNPCRILIGEATYQCLDRSFEVEPLQTANLRGKKQQLKIYSVSGIQRHVSQRPE